MCLKLVSPKLRQEVLKRDNHMCQLCNSTDKKLDVHHIIPISLKGRDVLENLISVCRFCHRKLELVKKNKPDTSGRRRFVTTPCCNYEQVTWKKLGEILHCTKCKKPFLENERNKS